MKTFIVITTIFNPTKAIEKFADFKKYNLVIVGDKKTPADWNYPNSTFLSIAEQESFNLARIIPYNHYCRKIIGYLYSIKAGADFIIDTDDDNIPKPGWRFPDFRGQFDMIFPDLGFVNIYQLFTDHFIWPRGLPLNYITAKLDLEKKIKKNSNCRIGIWQALADEDPDVDAIYRLTNNKECIFNERDPVVLGERTISPFNTQNTIFCKELFPLLYLPTYASFRYTDILRGLIAQPIMWLYGYHLGFTNATVIQKRNPHDYFKDFLSEIPMYETAEQVIETVEKVISSSNSISENLFNAYEALVKRNIIIDKEMNTLSEWIKELENLNP